MNSLYEDEFKKHYSEGYCNKCRSRKDIGGHCQCDAQEAIEAVSINVRIAKKLGYRKEQRTIYDWYYGTTHPIKFPKSETIWITPDGRDAVPFPDWRHNEKLALELSKTLEGEEVQKFAALYFWIGWSLKLDPSQPEQHAEIICRAWLAVKSDNESKA
jgi:hypothetical protein